MMIYARQTTAKAVYKHYPVGQERKCEDRRRSETIVFHALNDTNSVAVYKYCNSREIGSFRVLGEVCLQE